MSLLRAIIICPDAELAARLEAAVTATGQAALSKTVNRYPNAIDLVRTLRACAPEVIFLSFESVEKAQEVVKLLDVETKGIQLVAIHRRMDSDLLRETMRAGVRDFLQDPFEPQAVGDALQTIRGHLERKPPVHESTAQIFAFLPSKAGAGTSTVALNLSAAMARRENTHVLLSDFDLNSGMLRFMLKLQNEFSVIDAVEHAHDVDENLWPQLVTSIAEMDVLHAGRCNPNFRVEAPQIRALIDFMRRNYEALCFDLSGNLERYSLEIMQDCKRILMVCTPEIPSLHLAREKMVFLRKFDLESRVSVVLNRSQKKGLLSKAQVEEILGVPVLKIFPNDYAGVNRAMTSGSIVDINSELGKSFTQFAGELIEKRVVGPAPERKKFLEFFTVPRLAVGGK
jgi:pilus assembly protein CpaE